MKIRPLGDRVLVEPVEEEQKVGGIYIPDAAKEKPIKGKVLAIGKKVDKENKEIPFNVKVGDEVLLPKYGGTEVKLGDKKLQLVREERGRPVSPAPPQEERSSYHGKADQVRRGGASEDSRRR